MKREYIVRQRNWIIIIIRSLEPKGITVEEWNYAEEHVHILFRFVPNIDLSKIFLMNSLRKTNYEM
ncbi:transposase, partial [Bacillus mycoides]|uniref:transposase n=1 Tax=Bacillus mycoides TaxID=1405 RepID=UPI00399D3223